MWIHLANSPKDQVFLSCISHERSNLFHVPTTDLIPLLYCEETLCEQWFSLCDSASNCCVLGYHDTWSSPFIVDRAAERKSWYVSLCYSALADRLPQNEYPNPWTTEQDINPMDTIALCWMTDSLIPAWSTPLDRSGRSLRATVVCRIAGGCSVGRAREEVHGRWGDEININQCWNTTPSRRAHGEYIRKFFSRWIDHQR